VGTCSRKEIETHWRLVCSSDTTKPHGRFHIIHCCAAPTHVGNVLVSGNCRKCVRRRNLDQRQPGVYLDLYGLIFDSLIERR